MVISPSFFPSVSREILYEMMGWSMSLAAKRESTRDGVRWFEMIW
jgi:hypothetical protein